MKKFETWMSRHIKAGHDLEDMMFRPLIKWYRLHRGSDFWQLAFAACCMVAESGKALSDDETERLRDFADLASTRMEEEFSEIGYFVTKYGWEA